MRIHKGVLTSLLLLTVLVLSPLTVAAHESDEEHAHDNGTQTSRSYEFETPAGGSLSLLVRRAVQLYDQQNQDITLSPAQAIYAETNIVKALGERPLEVGEKVTVPGDRIEEFVKKSQDLSEAQTARWAVFAATADFDQVASLNPVNGSDDSEQTERTEQTENGSDEGEEEEQNDEDQAGAAEQTSNDITWLVIGAGALLFGAYYVFTRRSDAPAATEARRPQRSRKTKK
jgi:hypothetical protein